MQVKIWDKISYMTEALALLERCADNANRISVQRREMYSDHVIRRIEISERIIRTGEAVMAPEMEKIQFYFKPLPNLSFTLADAILLKRYAPGMGEPEDISSEIEQFDVQERTRRFLSLQAIDEVSADESSLETAESWITQLDTDDATKWQLLCAYRNREKQLLDIVPLLEAAQKVIVQTKEIWAPTVEMFTDFWKRMAETRDVAEDLKNYSGVNVKTVVGDKELLFCPAVINCNAISFHILDRRHENFCSVGIIFGEDFYFDKIGKKEKDNDSLPDILKLLGDKSKFKILMEVRDRGAYGAQLAKQLGLTTATISHHVSALVQKKLLLIEPDDHKVYFKLNKEKMREVLAALQDKFV